MTVQSSPCRIKIGNSSITNSTLVQGSLKLILSGSDSRINTSDGKMCFLRTAKRCDCRFLVFGNAENLATAPYADAEITVFSNSSQILKFSAAVSVSYEPRKDLSTVMISGLSV